MVEMEDTDLGSDAESESRSEQRLAKAKAPPPRRSGPSARDHRVETDPTTASHSLPPAAAAPPGTPTAPARDEGEAADSDAVFDDILASPRKPAPGEASSGAAASAATAALAEREAARSSGEVPAVDPAPAAGRSPAYAATAAAPASAPRADGPEPGRGDTARIRPGPGPVIDPLPEPAGRAGAAEPAFVPRTRARPDPGVTPGLPAPLPEAGGETPLPAPLPEPAAPGASRRRPSDGTAHVSAQPRDFGVTYDARSRPRGLRESPSQPPRHSTELAGGPLTGADGGADHSRSPMLASGVSWDCPFPREARRRGIDSAVVTLRVEVEADSRVQSVIVLSDPGDGFAQEARRCALGKRWQAGLDRSGNAARRTTVVNVRFQRNG